MPDTRPDYEREWHLDRKVPISLIATLILQTIGVVWWSATISQRVDMLERASIAAIPRLESVIRLETQVSEIHGAVQEIKALMNRR